MKFEVLVGTYLQFSNRMIQLKQGKIYDTKDFGKNQKIIETIVKRNKKNFRVIEETEDVVKPEEPTTVEEPIKEEPQVEKPLSEVSKEVEESEDETIDLGEEINKMTKKELIKYQEDLGLEVHKSMTKGEIKKLIKENR